MSGDALFVSAAVVSLLLIGMALGAILVKSLVSAVVFMSSLSLLASVLFLFVAAPDVAITEAAIGSGLTTLVFVLALYRTRSAPAEDGNAPMNRADESSLRVRAAAAMAAARGEPDVESRADTGVPAEESRKEVSRA
jgi:energy-converting hydrogenase B subunit D